MLHFSLLHSHLLGLVLIFDFFEFGERKLLILEFQFVNIWNKSNHSTQVTRHSTQLTAQDETVHTTH